MLARNLGVLGISTLIVEKNCVFRFSRHPSVSADWSLRLQLALVIHGDVVTILSAFTIP